MRFILLTLCLMAVSVWGQASDTRPSMYPDTLYDTAANFDTLYWAWGDHHSGPPRLYRDLPRPKYWERIPGRWDTTTVEVCDTVWLMTEMAWWLESVVKVDGCDSSLWRMKRSGPGHGSRLIRTQVGEVRYRDSLVVTPKAIRWE